MLKCKVCGYKTDARASMRKHIREHKAKKEVDYYKKNRNIRKSKIPMRDFYVEIDN